MSQKRNDAMGYSHHLIHISTPEFQNIYILKGSVLLLMHILSRDIATLMLTQELDLARPSTRCWSMHMLGKASL